MFYIYLIQYLFSISEYKAMLIKLLIYHINIEYRPDVFSLVKYFFFS